MPNYKLFFSIILLLIVLGIGSAVWQSIPSIAAVDLGAGSAGAQ